MGYIHNGILHNHKEEQNYVICREMGEIREQYAKWDYSVIKSELGMLSLICRSVGSHFFDFRLIDANTAFKYKLCQTGRLRLVVKSAMHFYSWRLSEERLERSPIQEGEGPPPPKGTWLPGAGDPHPPKGTWLPGAGGGGRWSGEIRLAARGVDIVWWRELCIYFLCSKPYIKTGLNKVEAAAVWNWEPSRKNYLLSLSLYFS